MHTRLAGIIVLLSSKY